MKKSANINFYYSILILRDYPTAVVIHIWHLRKLMPYLAIPLHTMSTIYKDKLIEVTDREIVFHRYYFPLGGDKHLPLSQIESIQIGKPSFLGGGWRLWGTGDFRTWYPQDNNRLSRDQIFFVSVRNSFRRIGFTVEDSQKVTSILKERELLHEIPSD